MAMPMDGVEARDAPGDALLERERELAALERLLDEAQDGRGRLALIEGPAGIGKSRLLTELRALARAALDRAHGSLRRAGARLLLRRGAPAVRARGARSRAPRPRLFAGAGRPGRGRARGARRRDGGRGLVRRPARALLGRRSTSPTNRRCCWRSTTCSGPTVPSLRFVAYLVRRLEGAPVLVAATVRSTDPGTDRALLAEIADDPLCEAIRPGAARRRRRGRAGPRAPRRRAPTRPSATACQEATGGNPLLLRQLLLALREDGVDPTRERCRRGARDRPARGLAHGAAAALAPARAGGRGRACGRGARRELRGPGGRRR